MRLAFVGYGEAARAFRASLATVDAGFDLHAHDIDPAVAAVMRADGVAVAEGPQALAGADWTLSLVTADQSVAAARSVAPSLRPGAVFVDANSVSPAAKRTAAAAIAPTGAHYVDMAIMAPVHPRGHRTPVLVAGPGVGAVERDLDRMGWAWRLAGPDVGDAAGIKMIRSLFLKGLEAITTETLLAAEAAGVRDPILASLADSFPGLGWPDFAAYQFERTLRHGRRRAAEMEQSAQTLASLGLDDGLARAIATQQRAMGAAGAIDGDLDTVLAGALAARRRKEA